MRRARWAPVCGLALVFGYCAVLALGMARSTYDVWGALVVAPGLLLVSWPLLVRVFRTEKDGWVRWLIGVAFACKVLGALARWAVAFVLYDGVADASMYNGRGGLLAEQFRSGSFVVNLHMPLVGTGFLILLTGIVYAITGPTLLGGYLVYAWMGFWGLYFFYRAFRIAMPGANHRRYAVLVFFLPSMVFWPSGIGKEAWLCLCIGLASLGAARLITGTRRAVVPLLLGLAGSAMVRPHMTAIVLIAAVAGYLFRRDVHRTALTPLVRGVTLALLAVVGVVVASQAAHFFGVSSVSVESVDKVLNSTSSRTLGGGSAFVPHPVHSPVDLPGALLTVLYRPFLWEAHNIQVVATAVEGSALLALTVLSCGRLKNLWKLRACRPFVVLSLAYIGMFVWAFSTFNNFGLLARERCLVYPFLLALLALPTKRELQRAHTVFSPTARKALVP